MTRAEDKYDLQLVKTQTGKPPPHQPWYRERLRNKHLKEVPGDRSYPHLVGTEWTFVKDGLDDFRDGYPPEPAGGGVIPPVSAVGPQLQSFHRAPKQQVKPRLTKEQVLYSKTLPGQQRRREYLESLIEGLKEHPLALYSHMEESVPPDMFEDLIDALDRDMMLGNEVTEEEYNHARQQLSPQHTDRHDVIANRDPVERTSPPVGTSPRARRTFTTHEEPEIDLLARGDKEKLKQVEARQRLANEVYSWSSVAKAKEHWNAAEPGEFLSRQSLEDMKRESLDGDDVGQNGYRWLPGASKPSAHSAAAAGGALTPAEDAHIQTVTKNFCEWVAELGGDSNNIDESTVMGLFSGGYESKPALSVPIHVVELTNVPPELRMNSAAPGQSRISSAEQEDNSKLLNAGYVHTKPNKAVRYGAWYLKPKQWKVLKPGEDIPDPNKKEGVFSDAKRRSLALDSELASMHGAKEFIKFMRNKGNSVPDFLSGVATLQEEQTEESTKQRFPSRGASMPRIGSKTATVFPTQTGSAQDRRLTSATSP